MSTNVTKIYELLRSKNWLYFIFLPYYLFIPFLVNANEHQSYPFEFQGDVEPISLCTYEVSDGTSSVEALSCFWNNGYPYAALCSIDVLDAAAVICAGPRVYISDVQFSGGLPLSHSVIARLSDFQHGQLYDHSQVVAFIQRLENRLDLENVEVVFEQVSSNQVRMLVDGDVPTGNIGAGLFYDSESEAVAGVTGRHFVGGSVPGFIEYSVSASHGEFEAGEISVPVGLNDASATRLSFNMFDVQRTIMARSGTQLRFNVQVYSQEQQNLFQSESFGGRVTAEEVTTRDGLTREEHYMSVYGQWSLSLPQVFDSLTLRLTSHILSGSGLTGVLELEGSRILRPQWSQRSFFRLNSDMKLFLGSIDDGPISQRIYLGSPEIRGFYRDEIGLGSFNEFNDWGGRFLFSAQLDYLAQLLHRETDLLSGVHFDFGTLQGQSGDNHFRYSYGALMEYQLGNQSTMQFSYSINDNDQESFSINFNQTF